MTNDEMHAFRREIGEKMDRAAGAAFAAAIRRHREGNVPMAIWEDEQVKLVSPFDIPLPEELEAEPPKRRAQAGD